MKITSTPITDDTINPVNGKYQGIKLGNVPASYLDWLSGQEWLERKYPVVATYIKLRRKYIDLELKNKKYEVSNQDLNTDGWDTE